MCSPGSPEPLAFQRVQSEESRRRAEPQSFSEFHAQLSAQHGREPHAFIDDKVDPLGFREEAEKLRRRLRKSNRMLLNPNSRRIQQWDLVMICLLLYTAIVAPYEVCMMWEDNGYDGLYFLNNVVSLCFAVDIVLNFFMPFRESTRQGAALVKTHRAIAIRYLRTWFPIDVLSVVPIDTILKNITVSGDDLEVLKLIRVLRLLRLIKLMRIVRAARVFISCAGCTMHMHMHNAQYTVHSAQFTMHNAQCTCTLSGACLAHLCEVGGAGLNVLRQSRAPQVDMHCGDARPLACMPPRPARTAGWRPAAAPALVGVRSARESRRWIGCG